MKRARPSQLAETGADRAQEALRELAKGFGAESSEHYFRALVTYLSGAVGAEHVFVCRLLPGKKRRARAIAHYSHGENLPGFDYDLAGTPCENVFENRLCVYGPDLQERFPEDRILVELGVHGYLGVPLRSSSGQVQGILSALFETEPEDIDHASTLFRICADRAGAELGRLAAEEQAQQAQVELEARVAERTRALRESEADYRAFVRSASEGIACIEPEEPIALDLPVEEQGRRFAETARIAHCNDVVARWGGLSHAEELEGARLADLPGFWRPINQEAFRAAVAAGYVVTDLESTSVGPDGEQRDILANVTGLVEDGKLLRLWCTLRDVTQHKREERALRESEAINKAIIQTALDGVVIVDGEGRILEVNDSFCELSGYTRAELVHGLIADFREGVTPEDVRRQLEWVRNQGSWREPGRVRRKDGRVVDVEASIVYQDVSGGRFVAFLHDISERLASAKREREHEAQLAHFSRLNTIGEMASGIAHELNQPLAAIVNYTSGCLRRLTDRGDGDEELRAALKRAAEQANRAGEIIRHMRNFVRKGEQPRCVSSINELARETILFTRSRASQLGVQVDLIPLDGDDSVEVDAIQIEQVLLNLIRNGFEAMDDPAVDQRRLAIEIARDDDQLLVTVTDTGPGLAGQGQDEVFHPFYTTKTDGVGLGLSISRSIIEAHGGRMWCSPPGDRGIQFNFTLPVERDAPDGDAPNDDTPNDDVRAD